MKNKFRRFIACLLVMMLISSDMAVLAESVLKTLTLPAAMQIIDEEAFYGNTSIDKVVVPDGTTEIRSKAFANSSLTEIELPDTLTFIAEDAFDGCAKFSVSAPMGCYAYEWAVKKGYIGSQETTPAEYFSTVKLQDGTLSIIDYNGEDTEVVIPDIIGGIKVTMIGDSAFESKNITSVVIPDGITVIGDYAFSWNWNLERAVLSASLKELGEYAFNQCNLKEIELPDGLQSIGAGAFGGNGNVSSIYIPASVTSIGGGVFYDWHSLESIIVADGNTAYEIVDEVLLSKDGRTLLLWLPTKKDTEYAVPDGVIEIADYAFERIEYLNRVTLPEALEIIGDGAFRYCTQLESIEIPEGCTTIEGNAFEGCEELTEITLPDGMETVNWATFSRCISLVNVVLPHSIRWIAGNAFSDCIALENINLPDGIGQIEESAFRNCPNLTASVVEESYAHEWCSENGVAFETVSAPEIETAPAEHFSVQTLGDGTLRITGYNGDTQMLSIPGEIDGKQVTIIGCNAFESQNVTKVIIPEGVSVIEDWAFSWCGNLWSVTLPSTLKKIGAYAFNCCNLKKVDLPDGFETIGESGFANNYDLTDLYIPASVTSIGEGFVSDCFGLKSVIFDEGNKQYRNEDEVIFSTDGKILLLALPTMKKTEYTVPEGVVGIANSAFQNAGELQQISLPDSLESIGNNAFSGCSQLNSITIPSGSYIGDSAFFNCINLTEIVIPEGVEGISYATFWSCSRLEKVTLPQSITSIGSEAFYECIMLKNINLPAGIDRISEGTFVNCPNLTVDAVEGSFAHLWCEERGISVNITSAPEPEMTPGEYFNTETLGDGTLAVTGYTGQNRFVWIPEEINGMKVTRIKERAFADQNITKVIIPEGVTAIEGWAFAWCYSLSSVVLPSTLRELGDGAFNYCNLTEIELPEELTTLGNSVFNSNRNLAALHIPASVTDIGGNMFRGCGGLKTLSVAEENVAYKAVDGVLMTKDGKELIVYLAGNDRTHYTVPEGVEKIHEFAFDAAKLESIDLPESLEIISGYAFYECSSLTAIHIPAGVSMIGEGAFDYCSSMGNVTVADNNATYCAKNDSLMSRDGTLLILYVSDETEYIVPEGVKEIGRYAFGKKTNLKNVILPEGLEEIGYYAFDGCSSLESIYIPSSCTQLGTGAFGSCESLTEIVLPEGIKRIEYATFYRCKSLETVVLPESMTYIGSIAFEECTGLTAINLPAGITYIESNAFAACPYIVAVVVEDSYAHEWCETNGVYCTTIPAPVCTATPTVEPTVTPTVEPTTTPTVESEYTTMMLEDGSLSIIGYLGEDTDIIIPTAIDGKNVTAIGTKVFWNHSAIRSIVIPEGVVTIGPSAFSGCTALGGIEIPNSVISIGDSAFANCSSLESVVLSEKLDCIEEYMFSNCIGLQTIKLPSGVESIGSMAFNNCGLTQIDIPDGVTNIGGGAFQNCKFETIKLPINLEKIDRNTFWGCEQLRLISVPDGVVEIGNAAFARCENLTSVTIPDTVQRIGSDAFWDCLSLQQLIVPSSVQEIGAGAFDATGEGFMLFVVEDSAAYEYAVANNIPVSTVYSHIIGEEDVQYEIRDRGAVILDYTGKYDNIILPYELGQCPVVEIAEGAFADHDEIRSIRISESVNVIGERAFEGCDKLQDIILPDSIQSVGEFAFAGCGGLKELNIPVGVTELKSGLFADCVSLEIISIPEHVTVIGDGVFSGTAIRNIQIPTSVQSIGRNAFGNCEDLIELILPEGIEIISEGVFYGCVCLKSVTIPESVKMIENDAFVNCAALTEIFIPDSVTEIMEFAFSDNEKKTIIVCGKESAAKEYAQNKELPFRLWDAEPQWLEIEVMGRNSVRTGSSATWTAKVIGGSEKNRYQFELISSAGETVFVQKMSDNNTFTYEFKEVCGYSLRVTSESHEGIVNEYVHGRWINISDTGSEYDFEFELINGECYITDINISGGNRLVFPAEINGYPVASVGNGDRLFVPKQVVISEGIREIGARAFWLSGMESIDIPDTVTEIGEYAFAECEYLQEIDIPDGVNTIKEGVFRYCSNLERIVLPEGIDAIGEEAFFGCNVLEKIILPNSLKSIGRDAFRYCGALEMVELPDSIKLIGENAFWEAGLKSITIPAEAEFAGAFYACHNLESVMIEEGVTTIGKETFACCDSLKRVIIPNSVSQIGELAFEGCSALKEIYFSESITELNQYVFGWSIDEGTPTIVCEAGGQIAAFAHSIGADVKAFPEESVPVGLEYTIGKEHYTGNDNYTISIVGYSGREEKIRIPEYIEGLPVRRIIAEAFAGDVYIREVEFPRSIIEIGDSAFAGCSNLERVVFADRLVHPKINEYRPAVQEKGLTLGKEAFSATEIQEFTIPGYVDSVGEGLLADCTQLKKVYVNEGISLWDEGIISGCNALEDVYLPASVQEFEEDSSDILKDEQFSYHVYDGSDAHYWAGAYGIYRVHCIRDMEYGEIKLVSMMPEENRTKTILNNRQNGVSAYIKTGSVGIREAAVIIADASDNSIISVLPMDVKTRGSNVLKLTIEPYHYRMESGEYYVLIWAQSEAGICLDGTRRDFDEIDIETYPYKYTLIVQEDRAPWLSDLQVNLEGSSFFFSAYDDHFLSKIELYCNGSLIRTIHNLAYDSTIKRVNYSFAIDGSGYGMDPEAFINFKGADEYEIVARVWDGNGHCTSNESNPLILKKSDCDHPSTVSNGWMSMYHILDDELEHGVRKSWAYICTVCNEIESTTGWESSSEPHEYDNDGICELCGYKSRSAYEAEPENVGVRGPITRNFRINGECQNLQVAVGDTLDFVGTVYGVSSNLREVGISVLDVNDPEKGAVPVRTVKLNDPSYQLWEMEPLLVGDSSGEMTAGCEYYIILWATDENGTGMNNEPSGGGEIDITAYPWRIKVRVVEDDIDNIQKAIGMIYPEDRMTIEPKDTVFSWEAAEEACYYSVKMRDLAEDTTGVSIFDEETHYGEQINIPGYVLKEGHKYRFSVSAYDATDQFIAQTMIDFGVRGADDAAIPSSNVSSGSIETQIGQNYYFVGQVNANGGELERISVDIVNETGERCYYCTYDAEAIMRMNGSLSGFDLANIPPMETGKVINGNYYTQEEKEKTMDLTKAGRYTIRIWAYNSGGEQAHIVSARTLELRERTDMTDQSQIHYFVAQDKAGYRNTYHHLTAETTDDVVRVELYIDGYKTSAEIRERQWLQYRVFDFRVMIHEPGMRTAELKAYTSSGECMTAKTIINILDADYIQLDMPELVSPEAFAGDQSIHGVAGYSFVAEWKQPANAQADEFGVRIWSEELKKYTFEGVSETVSIEIPAEAMPSPGVYTLTLIAIKEGYDNSDVLLRRIVAYGTYEDSLQAECAHAVLESKNHRTVYRDHSVVNPQGHYSKEVYDVVCGACGYVIEKDKSDSGYQLVLHSYVNEKYCLCGYLYAEGGINRFNSFDGFVVSTYSAKVYRAPNYQPEYGLVYPGEEVYVTGLVDGWYRINYLTSAGGKTGFIQCSKISQYVSFDLQTEVNGDVRRYEKIRYVDREYYSPDMLLGNGGFSDEDGMEGYYVVRDYGNNGEYRWMISFDFSTAKEGDTKKCPVSVYSYGEISTVDSRTTVLPIDSVTAKLLGGVLHFKLSDLVKLSGLRIKGTSVIPTPENYEAEYRKEIDLARKELKVYFESHMRENSNAVYSALTSFQADIWPAIFYMGFWDGIKHDVLKQYAESKGEIYNGDLLVRGLLMQKTQEYDTGFVEVLKKIADVCERVTEDLDDTLADNYDIYDMVCSLVEANWQPGDFDVFIKQFEQYDPYGSISLEEFFNYDDVKIKICRIYGSTLDATGIRMLQLRLGKWEGKVAKILKSKKLKLFGEILSLAPKAITEMQWQMLESLYKEAYLDYLDEWIAIEADPRMKKAYIDLKADIENELKDFVGFLDRSLFQDAAIKGAQTVSNVIIKKTQRYGSFFVDELAKRGKFGEKIKTLWEKIGTTASKGFSKALATANLADSVSEGGLFLINMTTGVDLEDAKKRSEEIVNTWDAYDVNVKVLSEKLENINEANYEETIEVARNCINLLNYLFKLYGDEKEAAWDWQISEEEVASYRDANREYIYFLEQAVNNFEELIAEYYEFLKN